MFTDDTIDRKDNNSILCDEIIIDDFCLQFGMFQ